MSKFGNETPNMCLNLGCPHVGAIIDNAKNYGVKATITFLIQNWGAYIMTQAKVNIFF